MPWYHTSATGSTLVLQPDCCSSHRSTVAHRGELIFPNWPRCSYCVFSCTGIIAFSNFKSHVHRQLKCIKYFQRISISQNVPSVSCSWDCCLWTAGWSRAFTALLVLCCGAQSHPVQQCYSCPYNPSPTTLLKSSSRRRRENIFSDHILHHILQLP